MTSEIISRPRIQRNAAYRKPQRNWFWLLRKVGQTFLWLVLGMALLGMFVSGPLGQGNIRSNDGNVAIEYFRLERQGTPSYTRVFVDPKLSQQGHTSITLNNQFLTDVQLMAVKPKPAQVITSPAGTQFIFDTTNGGTNKFLAEFLYESKIRGFVPISIGVNENAPIDFRLFFLP